MRFLFTGQLKIIVMWALLEVFGVVGPGIHQLHSSMGGDHQLKLKLRSPTVRIAPRDWYKQILKPIHHCIEG